MDLNKALEVDWDSPEEMVALSLAESRLKNAEIRRCQNGCANYYDPGATEPFAGFGQAGCGFCND